MKRIERISIIERMLRSRRSVSFEELMQRLEVSRATLYRDLDVLQDSMGVPLLKDEETGRYRLDDRVGRHELPGLWFSSKEIHALLSMQALLRAMDTGGVLAEHIEPLQERLFKMLGSAASPAGEVARRVRILQVASRSCTPRHFQTLAAALMERLRLLIKYQARGHGELSQREVSPQRLVHYRGNWYLDAWCHQKNALRSFAVDAILETKPTDVSAQELADELLDACLGSGYGIFAGQQVTWATLVFSARQARWVASEQWHPAQEGQFLVDGSYQLRLPYSQDTELIMDILKYGPDCQVVAPSELRAKVASLLKQSLEKY